jgi:hypothetical protein
LNLVHGVYKNDFFKSIKKECFLILEVCHLKILLIFAAHKPDSYRDWANAGVVELVDTLDLGLSQAKGKKNFEMRAWWNW